MSKFFDQALAQVPDDIKRLVDNSVDIANQIHSILERQGKTQRDLAQALGKNESEVSKWLSGTHNFTVKSISKIESVLNEKIITTPLKSQQDFLKMLEKAAFSILDARSSEYYPLVKKIFSPAYVEVDVQKVEYANSKGEKIVKESFYAMAA